MSQATLKQVSDFFRAGDPSLTLSQFSAEWKLLPEKDREQIRNGIGDGTLTY